MWDTLVQLPPLPLGNLNHIQLARACAELQPTLTPLRFAWISKYWQRQGVHLPTSSSDCTNDLTSELFRFSGCLYWHYSFEDRLCILIAGCSVQNVYIVLGAGSRAQVSPLLGACQRQHIRELCAIFQRIESLHLLSTTLEGSVVSPDNRKQLPASWHWPLQSGDPRWATEFSPLFPRSFHRWSSAELEDSVICFEGFGVVGHGHSISRRGLSGTWLAANWVAETWVWYFENHSLGHLRSPDSCVRNLSNFVERAWHRWGRFLTGWILPTRVVARWSFRGAVRKPQKWWGQILAAAIPSLTNSKGIPSRWKPALGSFVEQFPNLEQLQSVWKLCQGTNIQL